MKIIKGLTITVSMLFVLICTPTIKASTVTEALDMLALLRSHTEAADFTGPNAEQNRAFLLRKLDAAKLALDQARFCKAIKDLGDFDERMNKIERQAEIHDGPNGVTVHDLHDTYTLAKGIIHNLLEQSGATCKL